MKLDRNITNPRRGKYALIKLRVDKPVYYSPVPPDERDMKVSSKAVDFGNTADTDFFVIRLKDKYAAAALLAYANEARKDDPEYADEILRLANMAMLHGNKRMPD